MGRDKDSNSVETPWPPPPKLSWHPTPERTVVRETPTSAQRLKKLAPAQPARLDFVDQSVELLFVVFAHFEVSCLIWTEQKTLREMDVTECHSFPLPREAPARPIAC